MTPTKKKIIHKGTTSTNNNNMINGPFLFKAILCGGILVCATNLYFTFQLTPPVHTLHSSVMDIHQHRKQWKEQQQQQQQSRQEQQQEVAAVADNEHVATTPTTKPKQPSPYSSCNFRRYPPRQYYGLDKPKTQQPDFLVQTEYIYGEYPIMLEPSPLNILSQQRTTNTNSDNKNNQVGTKLCVDQSEWLEAKGIVGSKELPFADGTNPSIIAMERLLLSSSSGNNGPTFQFLTQVQELYKDYHPTYIATVCMSDSQCSWGASSQEISQHHLSTLKEPSTLRAVLLILDDEFHTILETTIYLQVDAPWGKGRKKIKPSGNLELYKYDDCKLFAVSTDNGEIELWLSYREGPLWGYETQVLNKLHLSLVTDGNNNNNINNGIIEKYTATIKASETISFDGGRNMALMESVKDHKLHSLTWVDPVTVIPLNIPIQSQQGRRRLMKQKKSHIHGTNGFMVYLEESNEYLGVGHFHRPWDRNKNPYARHGHHYTHAFYTISGQPPYTLQRLSAEFVLPAFSLNTTTNDAEIIQFISGLERLSYNNNGHVVVLAYGINDCEGAAMYLDMDRVNALLRPVSQGQQVVDFMKSYHAPPF